MSEVLIKGMKMPKSCPCELVGVGYNTYCSFAYGVPSRIREHYECCKKQTRPEWCPLIEVATPHGDLIDRDKASERFAELSENIEAKLGYECSASYTLASLFLQNKQEFPTIIEKEG